MKQNYFFSKKISKLYLGALLLLLGVVEAQAQVSLTATGGTTTMTYTRLKEAFDQINAGSHTGVITIDITGNTSESASSVLNASGVALTSYTSVLIRPSGGAYTISGTIAGAPLIDLNGADNVTIDGLQTGGNALTINNLSTSATANTSTIRFINDATNNTITKASILGAATVPVATAGGNILFHTATTTGNDNNSVSFCDITASSPTTFPTKCINGLGTTTSSTTQNSDVTITNCNIYNYFLATSTCGGIYVGVGNTDWTITDNKVYQTASRAHTTASIMYGIYVVNSGTTALGKGFTITGNTVGYASNSGTGVLTLTNGSFYAIQVTTSSAATTATNINNNIVSDISITGASVTFYGINHTSAASANTININNNTVKNITQNTSTGAFYGIFYGGATNMSASNNLITNNTRTNAGTCYLLYSTTASTNETINGNIISNFNCTATSTTSVSFYGIYQSSTTSSGTKTFNNNTIDNITVPTSTATAGFAQAIRVSSGNVEVKGNSISNISGVFGGNTAGIYYGAGAGAYNITANKIYNMSTSQAAGTVNGIYQAGNTGTVSNNIIGDLKATAANVANAVQGINIFGGTSVNLYHNTVHISATSTGAAFGSSALLAGSTVSVKLINNILVNKGISNGATGFTSAFRRTGAYNATYYDAASNNNIFYADVPSATNLIFYDGVAANASQDMTAYRAIAVGRDVSSFSEDAPFISTTGGGADFLHIDSAIPTFIESGAAAGTGITTDFDGQTRGATADIGADEGTFTLIPTVNIDNISITPTGNKCTNITRDVSATTTSGGTPIASVMLNYSINGTAQTAIAMTGGAVTGTSIWTATLPTVSPVNATVTWSVVAQDGAATKSSTGTPYKDEPLLGFVSTLSATPSTVCANSNSILDFGTGSNSSAVGAGATTSTTYSNPFYSAWSNIHSQIMVRASEMTSWGFFAGNINSLGLDITSAGTLPMINFSLKVAHTTANDMTNFVSPAFTTVYTNASFLPVVGVNTMTFSTPFYWDGTSNLVFEFCHGNSGSSSTMSRTCKADNTSFVSNIKTNVGAATDANVVCSNTTTTLATYSLRPQFIINANRTTTWSSFNWSNGANTPASSPSINIPISSSGSYSVIATDINGCSTTASTSVTALTLPAAPTATNSVQCGLGIPTASVTSSAGASGTGNYLWYDAASAGNLIQRPPYGPLATFNNNDFNSGTVVGGAINGNASLSGTDLILHPNLGSQFGGLLINSSGYNSNQYVIDFDLTTNGSAVNTMADGLSFSFGDDASSTATVPNAEQGSGSKLRIGFDAFGAMPNGQGVYLMYNCSATSLTATTPGVLAYIADNSWLLNTTHITISINAAGQITVVAGAVTLFNNVQLPADFINANKANWVYVFKGRSGGTTMGTNIDNLVIQNNQPILGSTTYLTPISASTTFHVSEVGTNGCESTRTPLAVTVAAPPTFSASSSQSVCNDEIVTLQVTNPVANFDTYLWSPATSLFTDAAATTPYTTGTNAATVYFKSSTVGAITHTVSANQVSSGCNSSITMTETVLPATLAATTTRTALCAGNGALLQTTAATGGILQWQNSTNGTTWNDIPSATSTSYSTGNITTGGNYFYRATMRKAPAADCIFTTPFDISVYQPTITSTTPGTRCGSGTVSLGAAVSTGAALDWFNTATGGTSLGSGTPFTTPSITVSTPYYAQASEGSVVTPGGKMTATAPLALGAGPRGIIFTTTDAVDIEEIGLLSSGIPGTITIRLYDSAGATQIGADVIVNTVGTGATVAAPLLETFTLSTPINIPAAGTYRLFVTGVTGGNALIYESSGATYPIAVGDKLSITGSVTTLTGTPSTTSYYYFYALSVRQACSVRQIVPATVTFPDPFAVTTDKQMCNSAIQELTVTSPLANYNQYTWSPITNLYTDAAATTAYVVGVNTNTVYYKTTTGGAENIIADALNTSNGCGNSKIAVMTTMPAATAVASIPTICVSGTSVVSLNPNTGYAPGTIQWQESTNGTTYTNIPSATGVSYTTPTISAPAYYRATFADANAVACSTVADISVDVVNPTIVSTAPGTRCGFGSVQLSGTPSASSQLNWYAAQTGGVTLATGNTFNTPSISATTDFWVAAIANPSVSTVGVAPLSTTCGTQAVTASTDYPIRFNTTSAVTIQEVTIIPNVAGTFTCALRQSLQSTNLQTYTTTITAAQVGQPLAIPVNFAIATPGSYQMTNTVGGGYRISTFSGCTYPFVSAGGGFSIVGSATTSTSTTGTTTYNIFYDFKVLEGCEGARQAVTATVTPAPTFTITANKTICNDAVYELTTTSGASNFDNYQWSPVTNLYSDATGSTPYVAGVNATSVYVRSTTAGVNNVSVTGTNTTTQCANAATSSVTIMPAAAPALTSTKATICVSGTTTLGLSPATGYGAATVTWESSPDNVTFAPISGAATTPTYTTGIINSTSDTYFKATLKDPSGATCSSATVQVPVDNPQVLTTNPAARCGTGTVDLNATSNPGNTLNWYAAATGGAPIGTGTTFTTPSISANTTYYVGATSGLTTTNVGPLINTTGGTLTTLYAMVFDVLAPSATISTVKMYPTSVVGTSYTVILQNSANVQIASYTGVTTVTGTTAAPVAELVPLNFAIPQGTGYKLTFLNATSYPGAIRLSTGATYPYTIPGLFSITGNTFNATYVYYFFDWEVQVGCESPRQAVAASVGATTTFALPSNTSTALSTSCTDNNGWTYYGDGTTMGLAVNWAPSAAITSSNAAAKAAAMPMIGVDATYTSGGTAPNQVYAMKRYWNVTSPTFDTPVNVRFYFDPTEKSEVETAAGALPVFEWYKTVSSAYAPGTNVTANGVTGAIKLTGTIGTENGLTYVQFDGVTSFSGGTGAAGVSASPLPIRLKTLSAVAKGKINQIIWETSSEENLRYYIVEKSIDATNWAAIGTVMPNPAKRYALNDNNPATTTYYRLRNVDNDTRTEISNVVSVERKTTKNGIVNVAPNPTNAMIQVNFELTQNANVMLSLKDLTGRIVKSQDYNANKGLNTQQVDMSDLPTGTYFLSVQDGNATYVEKVVKQ